MTEEHKKYQNINKQITNQPPTIPRDDSIIEKTPKASCYNPEGVTEEILTNPFHIIYQKKHDKIYFVTFIHKPTPVNSHAS